MAPLPMTLEDLAWLSGRWESEQFELTLSTPRGGMILGTLRDVTAAGDGYFEFLRFFCAEDVLRCEPFARGVSGGIYRLLPSRAGADGTRNLTEAGGPSVTFENPADLKNRLISWSLTNKGRTLVAAVEGEAAGQTRQRAWRFDRR